MMSKKILLVFISIFFIHNLKAQDGLMDLFNAIPAPAEMVDLVMNTGKGYDASILNPTGKTDNYTDDYSRAVNFGIYSTDLGYATIYSQPLTELSPYLNDVEALAKSLELGEHINVGSIAPIAMSGDVNQLMAQTTMIFDNMSADLADRQQSDLAASMFFGGWLEGLYIACQTVEVGNDDEANQALKVRIAQQLIVSTLLLEELNKAEYASSTNLQNIKTDLEKIHKQFLKIVTMETLDEPNISDTEALKTVISTVRVVRNNLTK